MSNTGLFWAVRAVKRMAAMLLLGAIAVGALAFARAGDAAVSQSSRATASRGDEAAVATDAHGDTLSCAKQTRERRDPVAYALAVRDCVRRIVVIDTLRTEARRLMEAGWSIPEAHDEQRFLINAKDYGPMTWVFPSPYLGQFEHRWQIAEHGDRGILAALVFVDTVAGGALGGQYDALALQRGLNCVWLSLDTTANPAWRSRISQADASGLCEDGGASLPLAVVRTNGARAVDYPATTRFTEDQNGSPLIGLKCLDGWCDIGRPSADGASPAFAVRAAQSANLIARREGKISGWHDEQLLAEMNGGVLRQSRIRATLVPEADLASRSAAYYAGRWRPVAMLLLNSPPPTSSKYRRWGLTATRNRLWMRETGGRWEMKVASRENDSGVQWPHAVQREMHHDAAVPGTARFRFNSYDDGIWVPCGNACCYAEGDAQD